MINNVSPSFTGQLKRLENDKTHNYLLPSLEQEKEFVNQLMFNVDNLNVADYDHEVGTEDNVYRIHNSNQKLIANDDGDVLIVTGLGRGKTSEYSLDSSEPQAKELAAKIRNAYERIVENKLNEILKNTLTAMDVKSK